MTERGAFIYCGTRIEPATKKGYIRLHKLDGIAHVSLLSPEAANLIEILAAAAVVVVVGVDGETGRDGNTRNGGMEYGVRRWNLGQ